MDEKDREYMAGFNLGYELEKTLRGESQRTEDRQILENLQKSIEKVQGKSDRIEGIKEGRKVYIHQQSLQKSKEKKKNRDRGR